MGEDFYHRYSHEKQWIMVNRCNLCKDNEESENHTLIHCDRTQKF